MLSDQFAQACCIVDMHCFHPGDVGAAQFACLQQFLSQTQVFRAHGDQFASEGFIEHDSDYAGKPGLDMNLYF